MPLSWEQSYLGTIRTLAGDEQVLITVGARCVVRDEAGRVLLIQRSDDHTWALPAGTMELGESLTECAIREVREETGLIVTACTPFAFYSAPTGYGPNMFGHTYQHLSLAVRIDAHEGELVRVTDETVDARYYAAHEFPETTGRSVSRTLKDLEAFEVSGQFLVD